MTVLVVGGTGFLGSHVVDALLGESPVRYVGLRVTNAYGERQNPERPQGIVGVALARMRGDAPLTLFGDAVRDFVHVADVAGAVVRAVGSPWSGPYNVGSGTACATSELLARLRTVTGHDFECRREPMRAFDVPHSSVDITRATGAGWRPAVTLDEGLARTWDWFRQLER